MREGWRFIQLINIVWGRHLTLTRAHTDAHSRPGFQTTIAGWWENRRGFHFFFFSPLSCFHSFCLCAGSEYVEITQAQGQGGRDRGRPTANLHERWMGRGAGRVEVGGLETGTVISLGCVCVYVCMCLQEVCDLLAFVMEMGPGRPDPIMTRRSNSIHPFCRKTTQAEKREREREKEWG